METPEKEHASTPVRWWLLGLVGVVLLAVALWACIAYLPPRLYRPLTAAELAGLKPAEKAERLEGQRKLQNDARTTLLQGLAALLVLSGAGIGATVTLRQVRISREQLQQTREQAREQLDFAREQADRSDAWAREQLEATQRQLTMAEQGQITERFTRAVDQLGHREVDVQLGGIYALERIARDSEVDRTVIYEVLTAYIRTRSMDLYRQDSPGVVVPLQRRSPSLHAALTVLRRRVTADADPPLQLEAAYLRGADLSGAQLAGAHLDISQLQGSTLVDAQLTGAHLDRALLSGVNLAAAQLTGAHFSSADLQEAILNGAKLRKANLDGANLNGAKLRKAILTEANLHMANLVGADLQEADLTNANLQGAYLTEANLDGANLTGADLRGAVADDNVRWPDGFDPLAASVTFVKKEPTAISPADQDSRHE